MADYTKAVSFERPKDDIKVTNLKDNPFVDEKTGKLYLPSLYTQEEVDKFLNDKDFKIHRTFFRKKYGSLQQSVAHMYTYVIADDFNYVMSQLSDEDLRAFKHYSSIVKQPYFQRIFLVRGQKNRLKNCISMS